MLGTEFSNEITVLKANQLYQTFLFLTNEVHFLIWCCQTCFVVYIFQLSLLHTTCKVEELRNPFIFYSHSKL